MPLENTNLYPDAVRSDIVQAMVNLKANACPMAVRLAWHASGTFDARDCSGGSNGATMRFAPEMTDDANAGLGIMRDMLEPVLAKHPELSHADLWTFAGCIAIEFMGGPRIPFAFGRTDAKNTPSACPANGRLPDAHLGADHLRHVFNRMGLDDRDIVALSGAHTLGRCHSVRSGFDGPWSSNPLKFDNTYFRNLMNLEWTKRDWDGEPQFEDPSGKLMMLPTDLALKTDAKLAEFAQLYAKNQDAFFKDFAKAFSKLLHLGCKNQPDDDGDSLPSAREQASELFLEHSMHGSLKRLKELEAKADVHFVEKTSGRTALHKAAYWGHIETVKFLVKDCHLDPNVQDYDGDTALHDAARFGHVAILEFLAPFTNLALKNGRGLTCEGVAADMAKYQIASHLRSSL